jgi:Tol biopolymer transport system component
MQRHRQMGSRTLGAAMGIMLAFTAAAAQGAAAKPWRIAIVFVADADHDADRAHDIARQVGADLTHSGRVTLIDPAAFASVVPAFDAIPHFASWGGIAADALVIGHLARAPDGRLSVKIRLWNISTGTQMLGRQYLLSPDHLPDVEAIIVEDVDGRLAPPRGQLLHFPR